MAIKESTHWYDRRGKPAYTVIGANGKERNTTLRDARKLNLVPSVTTILGVPAKPALENWKINQALLAVLTLPQLPDESLDDFMIRAKDDSKQHAIEAAARGTAIHADVEAGFSENRDSVAYAAVKEVLDGHFPDQTWVAEDSFCNEGYGGKIDLYSPDGIVVDFKTKDGLKGKDPAKLVFDDHGMQLSAYAQGLGFDNPTRVSIFIDRKHPDILSIHVWDKGSHDRHLAMFNTLKQYWFLLKKYHPS
jgi:hypothetical protein